MTASTSDLSYYNEVLQYMKISQTHFFNNLIKCTKLKDRKAK